MKHEELRQARRSIRFLFVESALTRAAFVMPVVYLLWTNYLGMDQWQIGVLQAIFAATMLLLQFPTGYFADRISHKLSNSLGDLMLVGGMGVYFLAGNFWHAVIAEVLLGVGYSFSGGADSALLKKHAHTAKRDYKKLNARLTSAGFIVAAVTTILGGIIGSTMDIRAPFLFEGVLMVVAFMLSLFIADTGDRHITTDKPLRGMLRVVKELSQNAELLRRMLLGAALFSSTMMIVWFLTPMFFEVGISLEWHGLLGAAVSVAAIAGSEFAVSSAGRRWRLSLPLLIVGVTYLVLGATLSIFTFILFLVTSFLRGINSAKVIPAIQEVAPQKLQASAISLQNVFYRVFVIITMLTVNWFGNIDLRHGLLTAGIISLIMWLAFYLWVQIKSRNAVKVEP